MIKDLASDSFWWDRWIGSNDLHLLSGDICTLLSAILVVLAFTVAIRTALIARGIERAPHWYSGCCCRDSAVKLLMALSGVVTILMAMKLWSITDVISVSWSSMSHEYQIRAYVYLVENYGVCIISWVIGTYFKRVRVCAAQKRMYIDGVPEELVVKCIQAAKINKLKRRTV